MRSEKEDLMKETAISGKTNKVLNVGIKHDNGVILYGQARQIDDTVYALLHTDEKQELIKIDLWSRDVIIRDEEYVDDDHPLIKCAAAYCI